MDPSGLAGEWTAATLWAAFLLGLTGGFGHCLLMCGPFVAAASLAEGSVTRDPVACRPGRSAGLFQASYHTGRLIMYTLIGAAVGALGSMGALQSLDAPWSPTMLTRYLKLATGILLIVAGIALIVTAALGRRTSLPEPTRMITSRRWFARATGRLARSGWWAGLPLGMLMGLLPCMPLLPVELAALASGSAALGALSMLSFGLGTIPALAGFGMATGYVGVRARGALAYVTGAIVLVLGGYTVLVAVQRLTATSMPLAR